MIKNIKSILNRDERILHDSRVHWIIFVKPLFFAIIGILVAILFHPLVGGLILFMDLYPIYMATAFYLTTHLILTEQKVLGRTGFLNRDWIQLNLDRIETSYLEEPILGRGLGFSSVVVRGTGAGSIAFPYLVKGDIFVRKLERLLAKNKEASIQIDTINMLSSQGAEQSIIGTTYKQLPPTALLQSFSKSVRAKSKRRAQTAMRT